jgi:hypothetical protein
VTEFVAMIAMNLVTPKAAAKPKHLFNKPAFEKYLRYHSWMKINLKG